MFFSQAFYGAVPSRGAVFLFQNVRACYYRAINCIHDALYTTLYFLNYIVQYTVAHCSRKIGTGWRRCCDEELPRYDIMHLTNSKLSTTTTHLF